MEERKSLRELVAEKQIFAPCIWDVFSAQSAEQAGFEATLLSGGALAEWVCGMPDVGLITADDLVRQTEYICSVSPLPCCVDADDGYGETPLHAFRTVERLVKAGASALTLDDTTGYRGYNRWGGQLRGGASDGTMNHPTVSRAEWLSKIKASLEATAGTDCMVIARTECKLRDGLDEAIERCLLARELGAEMTLIIGLMNIEEAEKVAKYVPGWKMWPDVGSTNGVPDVELDDIDALGFNFVTCHILEKGAMYGMLDIGARCLRERSMAYHDTHTMGLPPEDLGIGILGTYDKTAIRHPDRWTEMEPHFHEGLPE